MQQRQMGHTPVHSGVTALGAAVVCALGLFSPAMAQTDPPEQIEGVLSQWSRVHEEGSCHGYSRFIEENRGFFDRNPDAPLVVFAKSMKDEACDAELWSLARTAHNHAAYQDYLNKYRAGAYSEQAVYWVRACDPECKRHSDRGTPEDAVHAYYDALHQRHAEAAVALWVTAPPGLGDGISETEFSRINRLRLLSGDEEKAVVVADVTVKRRGEPAARWRVQVHLGRRGERWRIVRLRPD
jgi:hypothetical protein